MQNDVPTSHLAPPARDLAPPSVPPPTLSLAPPEPGPLAELLAHPAADLASLRRAIQAHTLAAAERFSELLSLAVLTGVEKHGYQIETVRRVLRVLRGRALLADEVGLGKTIEALMVLVEYRLRGMVRRTLVLAPPPLVGQWRGELQAKAGLAARTTEDAELRQDPERFWQADGVVIASLALARSGRHAPAAKARPWDLVIVDEAHHVKNRTTLGWKLIDGLTSRFLLLLTATPIENDLEELYNLVTLLKPGQLATPAAFRRQFVDTKNPTSPRNRERLRALLAEVMIRNTRAQSGLRLPPRYVTTAVIDPAPEEKALYEATLALLQKHGGRKRDGQRRDDQVHDDQKHDGQDHEGERQSGRGAARQAAATLLLEAGSSPQAVQATLARMGSSEKHDPAFRRDLDGLAALAGRVVATRKAQALVDLVRTHGDKALVFSRYRRTLAYLAEVLAAARVPHLVFHGGMDGAAKQAALAAFREDEAARVLLSTDVGAEGQNLQFCHLVINFDLPWNPMLIEQRIGRLHRFGQTEPVRVFNLCARGTVEERVLEVLDQRVHLFELVVGEMDLVLGNLADERDLEERILALYAEARSEEEIRRGFDELAEELLAARARYERTRAFDEALFGKDYAA